jgi:signal transduction histidine kinase
MADDELGRLTGCFNALIERLQVNDRELRHTLHELTHARDAAEAANVQKSQFLANMSHEIRTPLNGVLAMAQIMALGDMADEQRERLGVIRNSGEALLEILNDILDVSKIEAGKLELDPIEFDVEGVIHAACESFAGVAEKKGLGLAVEIAADAGGVRLGDPARLRQIIANLVSNALKFTSAGDVAITARGLGDAGGDGLWISVRDTGIGMPAEKLPLLFQKFTQLDASTTRQFGGTGLGLAICHDLAVMMGGRIWAESVEGQGSTFYVALPLARVVAEPAVEGETDDALPENQGRVLRVLAAEDNPTNQMVLSTIIQIFGADLQLADNGALAVAAWDRGEFDVILMDIQMPVMDGISATREIRSREAAQSRARTPIIALSANAMVHQIKEYVEAGMDGHVAKPIELPKLHAALDAALSARMAAEAQAA